MTISLAQLKGYKRKRKKRRGRGDSSGKGSYSRRGIKGQRARSGGKKGLKFKGFRNILRSIPKRGGFKSLALKPQVVNLETLEEKFKSGEIIDKEKLYNLGIIKNKKQKLKILGRGELTKKIIVKADAFSEKAKKAIEKRGGRVVILK